MLLTKKIIYALYPTYQIKFIPPLLCGRTIWSVRPSTDEATAFCSRLARLLLPGRTIPSVVGRVHVGRPRRVRLRRLRPTFRNGCCTSLAAAELRIFSRGMLACLLGCASFGSIQKIEIEEKKFELVVVPFLQSLSLCTLHLELLCA